MTDAPSDAVRADSPLDPTPSEVTTPADAAESDRSVDRVEAFVDAWRGELTGQVSVSASGVQDRLLDLWGRLDDGDAKSQVERWLTETLERHLYEVADIERRLASLAPEASAAP